LIYHYEMTGTSFSAKVTGLEIALTVEVWKEGQTHVAYAPELDVSSCGKTASQAKSHLREAVFLFIEEAAREGTLQEMLREAGFERRGKIYQPRPILAREKMRLTLPAA
jgi:predicted RNase H-like HicB family nuclease